MLDDLHAFHGTASQGHPLHDEAVRVGSLCFRSHGHGSIQHELWHVWDLTHRAARGREHELEALRPKLLEFWQRLDRGIGEIEADLPPDTAFLIISDHGFGPIEHYVNFNVWLLEQGYIALKDSFYVKQKHWFYRRGATPEWIYGVMSRLGLGNHRVSRFRGNQDSFMDRLGESLFLSRRHIDWSRTRAYAQGNFGQIFLNLKGRQPNGCVAAEDARSAARRLEGRPQAFRIPKPASRSSSMFTSATSSTTGRTPVWPRT